MENFGKNILSALDGSLGKGPLCLVISCSQCCTLFELDKQYATMAIGLELPFSQVLKSVQNGTCSKCGCNNNLKHIGDTNEMIDNTTSITLPERASQ